MIDRSGRRDGRRLSGLGYTVTLALLLVNGIVLVADLGRPDRFWHLLAGNHALMPMFMPWVRM